MKTIRIMNTRLVIAFKKKSIDCSKILANVGSYRDSGLSAKELMQQEAEHQE